MKKLFSIVSPPTFHLAPRSLCMSNDAYQCPKVLLNVEKNAKIVIESDLCANVRIFALMNVSSHYWSPFHANDCVFSRNEQQKV